MVAVAIDESADDVRPWAVDVTLPVLYDPQHLVTELYAISNVPTVIWIDEADRIVRPNAQAFGTDLLKDITGIAAGPHLDAVRAWVRDGVVPLSPDEARGAVADLDESEVRARLHFRIAGEARRRGDDATARRHFEQAAALAPHDWTVRRASLPLQGEDPFGARYFELAAEWKAAGRPYHGLSARRPGD